MPTDKVKEFIKKLGAPKLTKAQVATIKDHHEYHGDKKVKIIGALPGGGVFVRCISHLGHLDSVIDQEAEIRFIKKWLNRNLGAEERRKLIKRGCL